MFRGINTITIDTKGRCTIPTRYRSALVTEDKHDVVVTIDPKETCLLLYPAKEWELIERELQKLPSFNEAARRIQRLLIGHATDIEIDANGRILLPAVLRQYALLETEVVLIGQGNKFEVWSKGLWETKRDQWLLEEASQTQTLPVEMETFSL